MDHGRPNAQFSQVFDDLVGIGTFFVASATLHDLLTKQFCLGDQADICRRYNKAAGQRVGDYGEALCSFGKRFPVGYIFWANGLAAE